MHNIVANIYLLPNAIETNTTIRTKINFMIFFGYRPDLETERITLNKYPQNFLRSQAKVIADADKIF